MTMRKFIGLALLLGGAAMAQPAGYEQLFLVPPAGWQIAYHDLKGGTDLTWMLPPGQKMNNWSEALTVELIRGKPSMDVQSVLNKRIAAINEGCEDVGAGPVQLSVENGYDVGLRAIGCPKSKQHGTGEMSLFKVILGRSGTYVVSRAWSGKAYAKDKPPLPANTMEDWLAFMRRIVVCDSGDRSHPCPTPTESK
jgi:hypothetical protein